MWPAIIRTVLLGAPGTVAPHSSWGKFSKRKAVTRLLVLHASSSMFRWSSADCITTLHGVIQTDAERQLTGRGDYIQPSVQSSCEMRSRRSGPTTDCVKTLIDCAIIIIEGFETSSERRNFDGLPTRRQSRSSNALSRIGGGLYHRGQSGSVHRCVCFQSRSGSVRLYAGATGGDGAAGLRSG